MKKRGFALVAAIFFIIIVATIAVTTLSTATMTGRDTVNLHAKEQAFLLAQSATEFAIMAMQTHHYPDITVGGAGGANCLERITLAYPNTATPLYNITVDLYYLNANLGCTANRIIGTTNLTNIVNSSGRHMALVDVTVASTAALGGIPIRYNRRTLQKP
ncbi:hypothetical protein OFO27_00235 [Campylobacter sp. CS_ED1]|nr:hypothetical protein [Campylobacter sp. CS_ED1]MDA3084959.1 hypothetical protein [Campylobacter sp. CS_ED1]MDA3089735.1 hypothetical protein [Campylobacter sp. CS_ED2]